MDTTGREGRGTAYEPSRGLALDVSFKSAVWTVHRSGAQFHKQGQGGSELLSLQGQFLQAKLYESVRGGMGDRQEAISLAYPIA